MKKITFAIALMALLLYGCTVTPTGKAGSVTVYKSESCGCCVGYIGELEKNGFEVNVVNTADMSAIKQKYGVPRDMQSCHTSVIDGYFIEGHVPIEAVNKLLSEKPAVDGIALPNMPAGSPGMPGVKSEPFKVYSIDDGKSSEFVII
jgi:hypothetical protein